MHVDTLFDNARYFTDLVRQKPGFQLVIDQPDFVNVCFWYVPASLRGSQLSEAEYSEKLHKVRQMAAGWSNS